MGTIDGMKSILTQSDLDALCEKFHIMDTVHPYEEMDLFSFIHHADPTKVRIGEREVSEGEGVGNDDVNEESGDDVVADQVEESDHAVQDEGANIIRIEDDVPASITKRAKGPERRGKLPDGLVGLLECSILSVETQHPVERFVVLSDSLCHSSSNAANAEVSSVVGSLVLKPPIMTTTISTTVVTDTSSILLPREGEEPVHASMFTDHTSACMHMDSETLHQIYVPKWNVVNKSTLDDPYVFCSLVDQLAPPTYLGAEVRMLLEHELRGSKKFKGKCAMQANLLKKRDAEIATIEATEAARVSEVDGLKEWNAALEGQVVAPEFALSYDELSIKASSLESKKDKLTDRVSMLHTTCSELHDEVSGYKLFKEKIKAVQDEQVKMLSDRVAELDSDLMGMALHLDEEFYPYYLTTIAGRRWILGRGFKLTVMKCLQSPKYLAALGGAIGRSINEGMQDGLATGIDHGKGRRGLIDVASYNPSAKANYIFVVNALRAVDFPLLAQLEPYKDARIVDIIGLLHLEGPAAKTPKANQIQPLPEQLMLPIHRLEGQLLSISDALVPLIELLTAKNLVGEASARPSTKVPSPPKIVFEKEELETTPEHTTVD
nr:hypothetical protein [Tanacetum cinerariifolium]